MTDKSQLRESRDDLLQCLKNVVVWLESVMSGDELSGEEKEQATEDIANSYKAITESYPVVYRFVCEEGGEMPLFMLKWHLTANDIPMTRQLVQSVKPEYSSCFQWGNPDIKTVRQTALAILLAEGYSEYESLVSHQAFARDVIGRLSIREDHMLDSDEIRQWVDEFEVSSSESSASELSGSTGDTDG